MRVTALLETLHQRGIDLTPQGDNLRYRAPKGALTEGLKAQILEYKPVLLTLLAPRHCPYCQGMGTPELNPPEILCSQCGEVLAYLDPPGMVTAVPVDALPIAQDERAAIYEFEAGFTRTAAEALARHGNVVGLPACPRCNGMTYQYEDGFLRCTTPWCAKED